MVVRGRQCGPPRAMPTVSPGLREAQGRSCSTYLLPHPSFHRYIPYPLFSFVFPPGHRTPPSRDREAERDSRVDHHFADHRGPPPQRQVAPPRSFDREDIGNHTNVTSQRYRDERRDAGEELQRPLLRRYEYQPEPETKRRRLDVIADAAAAAASRSIRRDESEEFNRSSCIAVCGIDKDRFISYAILQNGLRLRLHSLMDATTKPRLCRMGKISVARLCRRRMEADWGSLLLTAVRHSRGIRKFCLVDRRLASSNSEAVMMSYVKSV